MKLREVPSLTYLKLPSFSDHLLNMLAEFVNTQGNTELKILSLQVHNFLATPLSGNSHCTSPYSAWRHTFLVPHPTINYFKFQEKGRKRTQTSTRVPSLLVLLKGHRKMGP